MTLPVLNTERITRGETVTIRLFDIVDADDADVTTVTTIEGVAVDRGGLEDDITFTLDQESSTNAWRGTFTPVWSETPETVAKQTWAVRVVGDVLTSSFAEAGRVVVYNWR